MRSVCYTSEYPFELDLKLANSFEGNPCGYQLIAGCACKVCGARGRGLLRAKMTCRSATFAKAVLRNLWGFTHNQSTVRLFGLFSYRDDICPMVTKGADNTLCLGRQDDSRHEVS